MKENRRITVHSFITCDNKRKMKDNFILLFSSLLLVVVTECTNLGRGFGDKYEWHDMRSALALSEVTNKPIMMIIHKSWCGACKALKPRFASSKEIKRLSKHFVMANLMDDEEPNSSDYSPDGGYIPRILFISPDGEVREEFYNEGGNPSYKYFYSDPKDIVSTMKKVLSELKKDSRATEEL